MVTVPNYQSVETVPLASPASVSGLPLWTGSGAGLRWTLDLDRLRECYIHTASPDGRLVPFCVYNLTDKYGRSLYRNVESKVEGQKLQVEFGD